MAQPAAPHRNATAAAATTAADASATAASSSEATARDAAPHLAFAAFSALWTTALLAHQVFYRAALESPWDAALTAAALFALLRPSSPHRLLAACAFHIATVFYRLPDCPNHWYFSALHSLTLCLILAPRLLTAAIPSSPLNPAIAAASRLLTAAIPSSPLNPAIAAASRLLTAAIPSSPLNPAIAAASRLNLAILYFFSGFHKLNESYFSLETSCGAQTYGYLLQALPFLPDSPAVRFYAALTGCALELTLPILLFIPRLRRLAILLGLIFHLGLGLMSYRRFSLIAFALLTASLPELGALLAHHAQRLRTAIPSRRLLTPAFALLAATALFAALRQPLRPFVHAHPWLYDLVRAAAAHIPQPDEAVFSLLSALLIAGAAALLWRNRLRPAAPLPSIPAARPALLAIALVFLSGLSPYLGLRTLNAFAMYSNLRTEGGRSNHFLIPASWQPFSYQRDLVAIESSNLPELQSLADQRLLLPYHQLRVILSRHLRAGRRGIRLTYLRAGQRHLIPAAELHPELGRPLPLPAVKFFTFRPIEPAGPRHCSL